MSVTLEEIRDASSIVHQRLSPTPQINWPLLSSRTGAETWVKHENHQPVGAFKVRGGLVYLHRLMQRQEKPQGVITATRGNHGQSIAFAAGRYQLPCVVVVPFGNSVEKNAAMQALGADLIEHGQDFNEAAEYAFRLADQRQLHFVPSYHPWLIQGVSTYWLEFFEQVSDIDTVFVPIGMGSGICSAVATRDALKLKTKIIGIVSTHAPAYALSFESNEIIDHPTSTKIADGVAVRCPDSQAIEIIRGGVDRIVQVTDEQVAEAMRAFFVDTHNVAEGAGAVPLAGLLSERERHAGQRVGLVLTGANVDHDVFAKILAQN